MSTPAEIDQGIMYATMDDFSGWVNEQLNARGWGYSELARRSGLSTSGISSMMTGQRQPGLEMCVGIARAFRMRPEEVLYRAGLLEPPPPRVLDEDRLLRLFRQLNAHARETAIGLLSTLAGQQLGALAEGQGSYYTGGDQDED